MRRTEEEFARLRHEKQEKEEKINQKQLAERSTETEATKTIGVQVCRPFNAEGSPYELQSQFFKGSPVQKASDPLTPPYENFHPFTNRMSGDWSLELERVKFFIGGWSEASWATMQLSRLIDF